MEAIKIYERRYGRTMTVAMTLSMRILRGYQAAIVFAMKHARETSSYCASME